MINWKFYNNFSLELSSGVLLAGTTFPVTSRTLAGPLAVPYLLTIGDEIVKVTADNTTSLTVERAKEGTSAADYDSGEKLECRMTAGIMDDIYSLLAPQSSITLGNYVISHEATGDTLDIDYVT